MKPSYWYFFQQETKELETTGQKIIKYTLGKNKPDDTHSDMKINSDEADLRVKEPD